MTRARVMLLNSQSLKQRHSALTITTPKHTRLLRSALRSSSSVHFAKEYLGGIAVFSVPMTDAVITRWLGLDNARDGLELGRLVLLDSLETNAESFFIGKAFRLLRRAKLTIRGVVDYCDPIERRDESGAIIKFAHSGVVYHATNARLIGRSAARQHMVTPNGRVVSPRALSKLANDERGTHYVLNQLASLGAPQRKPNETGKHYVQRLLGEANFLRKVAHPGNFVFTWSFG